MGDVPEKSAQTRRAVKKISGIMLLWGGIAAIIISFLIFSSFVEDIREPESIMPITISFFVALSGFVFMITGTSLYFVGKNQEKKRSVLDGHDSQSE